MFDCVCETEGMIQKVYVAEGSVPVCVRVLQGEWDVSVSTLGGYILPHDPICLASAYMLSVSVTLKRKFSSLIKQALIKGFPEQE